ncbi:hypothetical protein O0235_02400 [Tepidiforma flava]|uniref:Uncharacterized protein n=1 Tax=Tepidiforma flava TaxID=3004094 RepID=A0ABY7M8S6_9CHLR|nr:hypothetical protein [Tepidiforma flava]WBL36439.1 hypothetical protein O0235_02400 [Tepidiforma flava]
MRMSRTSQRMRCPAASWWTHSNATGSPESALEVGGSQGVAALAAGLEFGADGDGVALEELFAREAEEAAGIIVGFDEPAKVEVEDDDGVAGVVEERAVALLGFAGAGEGSLGRRRFEDEGDARRFAANGDVFAGDADLEDAAVAGAVAPVAAGRVGALAAGQAEEGRDVLRRADIGEGEGAELLGSVAVEGAGGAVGLEDAEGAALEDERGQGVRFEEDAGRELPGLEGRRFAARGVRWLELALVGCHRWLPLVRGILKKGAGAASGISYFG